MPFLPVPISRICVMSASNRSLPAFFQGFATLDPGGQLARSLKRGLSRLPGPFGVIRFVDGQASSVPSGAREWLADRDTAAS
jgi:hypothetical protein